MKKQSLRIFLMCSLLAILAVSSAQAQSTNEQTARIPFSFSVGNKTFPAGEYRVTRINPQSSQAVLVIKSMDGRQSKLVLTNGIQAAGMSLRATLVFNNYDGEYVLAQVWAAADNTGLELPKSRREIRLARNTGRRAIEQTTIALNARPR